MDIDDDNHHMVLTVEFALKVFVIIIIMINNVNAANVHVFHRIHQLVTIFQNTHLPLQ